MHLYKFCKENTILEYKFCMEIQIIKYTLSFLMETWKVYLERANIHQKMIK